MSLKSLLALCICMVAGCSWSQNRQEIIKISFQGRFVDENGKPLSNAHLYDKLYLNLFEAKGFDDWRFDPIAISDSDGMFSAQSRTRSFPRVFFGYDPSRKLGGYYVMESNTPDERKEFVLRPLREVQLQVRMNGLERKDDQIMMSLIDPKRDISLMSFNTHIDDFLYLPAGAYQFDVYAKETKTCLRSFEVTDKDKQVLQLDMEPSILRALDGKEPPEMKYVAIRGLPNNFTLSDHKGKWVIVEFWSRTCGFCISQYLPHLKKFYEEHQDKRDQFEVVTVHWNRQSDNFSKYDAQIAPIRKRFWNDEPLPFPIMLDPHGDIINAWGIYGFPAIVLIDPSGKVKKVDDVFEYLENEISKKASAKQ